MPTAKSHNRVHRTTQNSQHVETPKEITKDVVDYLTEYVKQNPGYAALGCVGLGFVLGWKLKPW
jgi:hypothetical protein